MVACEFIYRVCECDDFKNYNVTSITSSPRARDVIDDVTNRRAVIGTFLIESLSLVPRFQSGHQIVATR